MGCASSKHSQSRQHAREAQDYEARKKNGFKDPKLHSMVDSMAKQKKKLKHVEDPLVAKKVKQQKAAVRPASAKKNHAAPKTRKGSPPSGEGAFHMTQSELEQRRRNLKHRQ